LIWKIVAAGRPALPFARDAVDEYLARIGRFSRVETVFVKPGDRLFERMLAGSEGFYRVVLDERGRQFSSMDLAHFFQELENRSISRCALLVGGSDGWNDDVRARADLVWSLGSLTLQHELALVVALEQIYRTCTIKARLPYHREG